jgi:hypothetical protein
MFANDIDEKFGRLRYSRMVLDHAERKESREKNNEKKAENFVLIMTIEQPYSISRPDRCVTPMREHSFFSHMRALRCLIGRRKFRSVETSVEDMITYSKCVS